MHSVDLRHTIQFSRESDHDDLYDTWLRDGKETEVLIDPVNTTEYNED